jgi:anti-anti-sigma regulatory factor
VVSYPLGHATHAGAALKIEQSTHNDYVRLVLHGDLNLVTAPQVRRTLAKQLAEQPPAIICDLTGVTALDPRCASLFSSVRGPASPWPGTTVVLCSARPPVDAVLNRLQVPLHLPVCDTFDEAIQHALDRPPHLRDKLSLAPTPAAAAQARAFTAGTCTRWALQEMAGIAVVLVNELVTNAVTHAKTPLTLRLELFGGQLTIAVQDQSPRPARRLQPVDGHAQHGLTLVASLAKAWGCRQEPGGKVVWCALDVL